MKKAYIDENNMLNTQKIMSLLTLISHHKTISDPINFLFIIIWITEHLWTDINVASYWSTSLVTLTVASICNHIQTLSVATNIQQLHETKITFLILRPM